MAGVVTLQSGIPIAVTQVTNFNAFAGFGTQRPNLIADPNLPPSQQTTAQFFNTAAFVQAPQFTLGSSSRNPVRGPRYRNFDLALIKRIRFSEAMNLELRCEAFNVTNTPPLGTPNAVLGPGFGFNHLCRRSASDSTCIKFNFQVGKSVFAVIKASDVMIASA